MKHKTYETTKPKSKKEKFSFKIKVNTSKLPNKIHLDAQISYPARIHEDKRFKKPKHKKKTFEEE